MLPSPSSTRTSQPRGESSLSSQVRWPGPCGGEREGCRPPSRSIAMDDTQTTDASLLGRIAQRDLQALELFYARHARPVFSLALALLGERARAEDLTHEVFLLVWRSAGAYQPCGSGRGWLLRLTRNRALDELRRDRRRRQVAAPLPDHVWQAIPAPACAVEAAEAPAAVCA